MTPDEARALLDDDPVAQRLLESANPARMAYVARDGTPRVIPVGFLWTGTTIVVGTVPGSAKVRALDANPSVALTIDTSPPVWPPNALFVRGTAEVTIVDGVFPEYVEASRKVTPPEAFAEWETGVNALYDQMARIDITVKKPLQGRLLNYGNFVFESAAQEQGLRDIRYVGSPDERDLAIQRVVQRAGLRGPRVVN